jgi:hypothetical protein
MTSKEWVRRRFERWEHYNVVDEFEVLAVDESAYSQVDHDTDDYSRQGIGNDDDYRTGGNEYEDVDNGD